MRGEVRQDLIWLKAPLSAPVKLAKVNGGGDG
jgi:hypothetical protein